MFEQNGLEAMLAYFLRFRPGTLLIRPGRRACGCRTGMALLTAGFAQCVCQGFTTCRFLVFFSLLSGAGPRCWSPRATCKPGA